MTTFFISNIVFGVCFVLGVLVTIVVLLSHPVKLSDQEGIRPIEFLVLLALCVAPSLFFMWLGAWPIVAPFVLMAGVVLGIPFCTHFAPYLDDLKAFLWTPQKAGTRNETMPCYPKAEPIPVPVEEESMAMIYYSRD
jgi:hypothetical protein